MLNLKRQFIWALAVIMLLGINVSAQNSISGFSDMENNWAKQSVGALVELGIINGYSDGTFKPNNTITRSEFTKIIRIAMKYELVTGSSFKDTATSWAKNEIHTVVVNGGIDKVELGESFYPAKNITRLEMAKMIVRSLDLDDKAKDKAGNPTNFSDDKLISSADKGYILIASENKIINGYSDKRFNPNGEATRAEASQMIMNMLNYIKNNDSITQLTSTSVATNTASPNLANEKYVSMKTIKVENGKVLLKDKLESGNYTALKTTALPKINDMVIDVTNALVKNVNDTDYVNVFYESEAVAPMAKIVLLDEKDSYKILSIGIAEEYMTMNLFDNRMSAKAIAYMHIDNFEKDEYSIYKRKVEDTIIAMFGETDGEKISEYVMSKYDEKRSPEVMKKGFASYAGKHETKIFGKVRVDWINDRWMPDSTIDVYFTINK